MHGWCLHIFDGANAGELKVCLRSPVSCLPLLAGRGSVGDVDVVGLRGQRHTKPTDCPPAAAAPGRPAGRAGGRVASRSRPSALPSLGAVAAVGRRLGTPRRVLHSRTYVLLAAALPEREITQGGVVFRMDPLANVVAQRLVTFVSVGRF